MGAYRDRVLQDSPSSFWPLDEASGSTADDVQSNNYNGTTTGLTWGASGPYGSETAASFDSTDRIDVGDHYGFTGTGSFTISAWIKPSNVTGGKRIIQKCDPNSPYKGWQWYLNGNVQEFERDGGSAPYYSTLTGSTTISASTWTHVAVTYDGTHLRFYKNGVLDAAGALSNTRSIASTTNTCIIGNFVSPYSFPMTGDMCNVALWDGSALSAATLLAHYYSMYSRLTSDTWAWSDVALREAVKVSGLWSYARASGDTWGWSDSAAPYTRRLRQPSLVRAEGANTQLNGAQALNGATITVDSTAAFPSSGTAYVAHASTYTQTSFTYTGKTATTFTGCSGGSSSTFADNSPVGASDAQSHFPSVNALEDTANPRILVTYNQHFAHAGGLGRICGKVSTDGGVSWGTEKTLISGAVGSGTWMGIYGHTCLRLADGSLYVAWAEQELPSPATLRSYSSRGTPDGSGWFTFDTPVQVTSPFHADSCYVGFKAFEFGGYIYQPVYGTDNSPYGTYYPDSYVKLLRTSDKGATWSTVGTIASEAQLGGIEGSECHIVILPSGRWLAFIRHETTNRSRLKCYSDDEGVTWTGHDDVFIDYHGNDPTTWIMPEGHIVIQGQELRPSGGGVYGSTVTWISTDGGGSFPSTQWRQEENDATYSIGNGAQFATIADTSVPGRRVLNAYAQERSNQGGAQVKFQWYAVPDFPLTNDTWAWSDSATRVAPKSRTTSDAWAWSDGAVAANEPVSRATGDSWAWSDSVSTADQVFLRATSDAWSFSSSATGTVGPVVDTWSWADIATVTTSITGAAGRPGFWIQSVVGADLVLDGVVDASLTFTAVV